MGRTWGEEACDRQIARRAKIGPENRLALLNRRGEICYNGPMASDFAIGTVSPASQQTARVFGGGRNEFTTHNPWFVTAARSRKTSDYL